MDLGSALVAILIAMVVKVAVMVLAARMVLKVYRAVYVAPPKRLWLLLPDEHLPEVRILWWALVLFFVSEFACGIEVYILLRSSAVIGWLHGLTSGAGMALFAVGLAIYLDKALLMYGSAGCLGLRLCRDCTVHEDQGCKFLPLTLLCATFVVLAAAGAFFVPTDRLTADTSRYILPFPALNAWYDGVVEPWLSAHFPSHRKGGAAYFLSSSVLVLEFRILPAVSGALAVAGIVLMRRRRGFPGALLAAAAAGMLCYSYLGIVLNRATGDILIGGLGHELAELWFLVITAEFLARCFGPGPGRRA